MCEITQSYGCLEKNTMLCINDEFIRIEDVWDTYKTSIVKHETIDIVDTTIDTTVPNEELNIISFISTGKSYKYVILYIIEYK